ncbi:hypothetical protein RBH29_08750 [Herbivorax sp. ANBcel31]|uniref:hypothetical protein n=1 Tax=Herbivorax sp. ANBcel31 TaxID=3069754 RepID=UPI0027B311DA|nr:hypothetical protein [Herbivorax sp. ANBcel31]MDQ2086512.1 hypothetical protein [Herbivorax sp. ANBcel31]
MKKFLIDRLLFPKTFFKKLNDKLHTLYIGIALIGLINLGLSFISKIPVYFFDKPPEIMVYNISFALCVIILVGLADTAFFAMPLFDIFKYFALRKRIANIKGQIIKLMKIYIVSHFLVVPVSFFLQWIFTDGTMIIRTQSGVFLVFTIIIGFWQAAIITRGIYVIYTFHEKLKSLVFFMVFTWIILLEYSIGYLIDTWLMRLFM